MNGRSFHRADRDGDDGSVADDHDHELCGECYKG